MFLGKLAKKVFVCGAIMGLVATSYVSVAKAECVPPVPLPKSKPWANSNSCRLRQASCYGNVYRDSEKKVAFVLEYKDSDGQWCYEKTPDRWDYWSAGTIVPTQTGRVHANVASRLQLNPKGAGENGLGGHALGHMNKLS